MSIQSYLAMSIQSYLDVLRTEVHRSRPSLSHPSSMIVL
jgi:hypothetical protein